MKKVSLFYTKKIVYDIGAYSDRKTIFEGYNSIGMDVFVSDCYIGYGTYISDFSKLFNASIGKFTSIGQGVCTAVGNHPISDNISTSPSFFLLIHEMV